jgi:hypothetical protein
VVTIHMLPCRGSAERAVQYLLGNRSSSGESRHASPVAVAGDARLFEYAVRGYGRNAYLSCVLSYSESREQLGDSANQAGDELLDLLTGGLCRTRYAFFWVRHARENGTDDHLLISKQDAMTHLKLPLWSATEAEIKDINTFRRRHNLRHNLSDPDDPWRRRFLHKPHFKMSPGKRAVQEKLDVAVVELAAAGFVRTRSDIVEFFTRGYPKTL